MSCGRFSFPPITVTAPRYASSYPPIIYPPQRPQPPIVTQPSSNVVTTNTCTGNSCNTNVNNIDNSINSSFNTSNVAPLTPVYTTPPQYLVQYTLPVPTIYPSPQQGLSCVITASPSYIQNGQAAILSWASYGATNAWLSDGIGVVALNGSLAVRPNVSTNYTLTISGYGGTRTCSAYVNVSGAYPYVSLSQIPYTGFDLGTFGNAIYWVGLITFALASAYLVLYYRGGAAVFAGPLFGSTGSTHSPQAHSGRAATKYAKSDAPVMFSSRVSGIRDQVSDTKVHEKEIARGIEGLPTTYAENSPKDSMTFVESAHGQAPRIVVNRS